MSSIRKRFSILRHDWPILHWDFFLERETDLQSWRLPTEPKAPYHVVAEANFPHRLLYLDYEGPVSNDRGSVSIWDKGTYSVILMDSRTVIVDLTGTHASGRWTIEMAATDDQWNCTWEAP
ncbi:MAG: DNA polymerase ligase N-terminal domain-containing protein [Zavarzinella sp.]